MKVLTRGIVSLIVYLIVILFVVLLLSAPTWCMFVFFGGDTSLSLWESFAITVSAMAVFFTVVCIPVAFTVAILSGFEFKINLTIDEHDGNEIT